MSEIAYARYVSELSRQMQNRAVKYPIWEYYTILNKAFLYEQDQQRCTIKMLADELRTTLSRSTAHRLISEMIEDGTLNRVGSGGNYTIVNSKEANVNYRLTI